MSTVAEIESKALALSERDRAMLASSLLQSLPSVLDEEDEGLAEALRREAEMDADPSVVMTHAEFLSALRRET